MKWGQIYTKRKTVIEADLSHPSTKRLTKMITQLRLQESGVGTESWCPHIFYSNERDRTPCGNKSHLSPVGNSWELHLGTTPFFFFFDLWDYTWNMLAQGIRHKYKGRSRESGPVDTISDTIYETACSLWTPIHSVNHLRALHCRHVRGKKQMVCWLHTVLDGTEKWPDTGQQWNIDSSSMWPWHHRQKPLQGAWVCI